MCTITCLLVCNLCVLAMPLLINHTVQELQHIHTSCIISALVLSLIRYSIRLLLDSTGFTYSILQVMRCLGMWA